MKALFSLILVFFLLSSGSTLLAQDKPAVQDQPTGVAGNLCRAATDQDLWSGPSENFKKVRKVAQGHLLEIIGEKGSYYRVTVPDGFQCYVHQDYLVVDSASMGTISGARVNLRSIPGIEGDYPIFKVERGIELMVWDKTGEWYRVTAPELAYLYILKDQATILSDTTEVRNELAALKTTRNATWAAHRGQIQENLQTREKQEKTEVEIAQLESEADAGFQEQTLEEMLKRYQDLAETAPDEQTRRLAKARVGELEALILKTKTEEELKQRADDWQKERGELVEQIEKVKPVKPEPATHQAPGKGRVVTVIGTMDTAGSEIILRGGKTLMDRLYRVDCPDGRYILPDFNGLRLSIQGRIEDVAARDTLPLVVVERIAIL